ncbi:hypothetical protein ATK30_8496 [Amycolatopsis echigonensis]|uniref:ABC transporter family protein n=1 Tax=Amycolatopsis echigonensis TaxID=2576905 RepID=A0A2N3WUI5_9PSEU|nr:hypothetical protein ATK30_8496 [Amycolatopsis niigatensis]
MLIADEPTSALDVSVQASVLDLLADPQRELAFACLSIGRDLAVMERVADRAVVLHYGAGWSRRARWRIQRGTENAVRLALSG